jgi:ribosomal protein L11 methyltransferase
VSAKTVERILFRAILEAEYRVRLLEDGKSAVQGYALTEGEATFMQSLTPETLYELVGGLVAHRLVPLRVADRFLVASTEIGAEMPPDALPIYLGSHWAFGNGAHATTALALAALNEHVHPGDRVLDVGTGTGILAIAAARLGAASVLAIDLDPEAVEAASANVHLNEVDAIVKVEQGSIGTAIRAIKGGHDPGWNVVIANIVVPITLGLLRDGLARTVCPGGELILSSVKPWELEEARTQLRSAGLDPIAENQHDGWSAVIARRPEIAE